MDTNYYFSYGMNTDPEQMSLRTGMPLPLGRALVRDHGFRFALHADVFPQPGNTTYGVLWSITQEQLALLDIREGYPSYYDRKIVDVECGGKKYRAWMYYMTPGQAEYPPTDGYYSMLERGYTTFDVPKDQIVSALTSSKSNSMSSMSIESYKTIRTSVAYQEYWNNHPENVHKRSVRWFNSYKELVKFVAGKRKLREIAQESSSFGMSVEQLCRDLVEYDEIAVPRHFQVKDSWVTWENSYSYHQN